MMKTIFLFSLFFCLFANITFSQAEIIELDNPSFEDYPRAERVPQGWSDCGFRGESAPDTHVSGAFDVVQLPKDGETYLGMVTRDNGTYERVGQKLNSPLFGGQCYTFKISLCKSALYISASRVSSIRANYTTPIKLVILGGNKLCENLEFLAESSLVDHAQWKDYLFTFKPSQDLRHILLVAYYEEPHEKAYNGNLLIDNASSILPISCDSVENWTLTDYQNLFKEEFSLSSLVSKKRVSDTSPTKIIAKEPIKQQAKIEQEEKIPAIFYNSRLSNLEKEKALTEIITFAKENPLVKANVVIEEKSNKIAKQQIKLIKKALGKESINEFACQFTILKK